MQFTHDNNNVLITTKKGISPLIATVLIIGMVVSASAIVFLWAKEFQKQLIEKEGAASLSALSCATDIAIDALRHDTSTNTITVENKGRGKIDGFRIFVDDSFTDDSRQLNPGDIDDLSHSASPGEKVTIIPKIKVAKGIYQPCTEQKIIYKV
jgi:flagellin-like protein